MVDFLSESTRNYSSAKSSVRNAETESVNTKTLGREPSDEKIKSPLDGHIYPTPPHTPNSLSNSNDLKYLKEASIHAELAMEYEKNGNYEDAFSLYKKSIDILLKNVKGKYSVYRLFFCICGLLIVLLQFTIYF